MPNLWMSKLKLLGASFSVRGETINSSSLLLENLLIYLLLIIRKHICIGNISINIPITEAVE